MPQQPYKTFSGCAEYLLDGARSTPPSTSAPSGTESIDAGGGEAADDGAKFRHLDEGTEERGQTISNFQITSVEDVGV